MNCVLCTSESHFYYSKEQTNYFICANCGCVFMNPVNYLNAIAEKQRYETHNNNVEDKGYQLFVQPIVSAVLKKFKPTANGLDFGSGTGSVISKLLRDKNYPITTFDPYFDNNLKALETNYNFISCCEVMEHFYQPLKEFYLLKKLLKPEGTLFCMTELLKPTHDFENWYYKNDPSHVIFYTPETINWIAKKVGFKKVTIENRLIIFKN